MSKAEAQMYTGSVGLVFHVFFLGAAPQFFLTFQSHLSPFPTPPVLRTYSTNGPSWLSLSCLPASVSVFTQPGAHPQPHQLPLLSTSAHSAFKSHLRHLPVCKGLNDSSCALPSLPSFLCTLSFVQMPNIRLHLFTHLFPSSRTKVRASAISFEIGSPKSLPTKHSVNVCRMNE